MVQAINEDTPEVVKVRQAAVVQSRVVRRRLIENSITLLVFLLIFAAFGVFLGGQFLNVAGRLLDVHQSVPVLLLGLAVLVTLIAGLFDLSVAGNATLSCFFTIGLTVNQGLSFPVALLAALAIGVVVGFVNGCLVEWLKVNAFIATLGTGAVCTGLASVYSGGSYVGPLPGGTQLPAWFVSFGSFANKAPTWLVTLAALALFASFSTGLDRVRPVGWDGRRWLVAKVATLVVVAALLVFVVRIWEWIRNLSWMIAFLLIATLALWVLMQYTTFGRQVQAVGSNRAAAQLAGVKVRKQVIKSYVIGGLLAATAGICLAAGQGSASPDIAASFLLPAFAAAFLSTVVLSDGRFSAPGTVVGGVFVTWVGLGLIVAGLQPTYVNVINGLVLIGAVALSTATRTRR
ncbi:MULTISPECIES: ABC transporter permease [unclassified Pseudofrankia]|uniref:ABC transporter permease n=1 Tax=unclassified Pseudofrankia TaxID=2994372 RepID=UPI0008D8F245|nr:MULTISPECIES: ABC transporter permease [unclassified Pseudofrankia]MDT3444674.1 ABC transporter permease [Pseudofrankia sp. BMG5.37]OHV66584.1 hypothetical protein BCD48_35890 [Pseudofrankia sp. BMG5.36]